MKTLSKIPVLFLLVVFASAFSFKPGGEGFEIYLNNKVILQQFDGNLKKVNTVNITRESVNDKMTIKYWHCGKSGKNRVVTITDGNNKPIKVYRYPDTVNSFSAMEVPLKDILISTTSIAMKIYYSSSELPKGRALATVNAGGTLAKG